MVRSVLLVLSGAVLGVAGAYALMGKTIPQSGAVVPVAPQQLSCESDLAKERVRVSELEKRIAAPKDEERVEVGPANIEDKSPEDDEQRNQAVSWRVSALEKFIPLSDHQRERLQEKFREEQVARAEGRESNSESLEEIVGEEQATTYRQQVQAAFDRVQNQELEKEAVWMSRKLALSAQQEQEMRKIFSNVEMQVDKEFGSSQHNVAKSAQERVARMIAENKRRLQLRADALKRVLQPEQFTAYMREESESAAADMEVFHDSSGSQE